MQLSKFILSISLIIFLGIGFLLITNHLGISKKLAEISFFLLLGAVSYELLAKK